MDFSFANDFKYFTVRIEIIDDQCEVLGTGTGFFLDIQIGNETKSYVITNRHVVEGARRGRFAIHKAKEDGSLSLDNSAYLYPEKFHKSWIFHPDKNIDLAAYPLPQFIKEASNSSFKPYIKAFHSSNIPIHMGSMKINSIENILMIGYPSSLWDERNNLPIVRHGVTATDPKLDFNGKKCFVIDTACFPGSSGSPVVIYYNNVHQNRIEYILSGVLYAGPLRTEEGDIQIKEIPMNELLYAEFHLPINLGYVIKSNELLAFAKF
ncbi:S1 family peptidase [Roseivirga pacifica]|uniref:S1 family peptidase n=1 Tax=Roseivirga pacifica TaxID=1267423 RepID=UPI0020954A12|nr:serine protease [Roseivirga pacifica]MCO6360748.1 serine protease [Roseivirga pacifica]MCO6368637.1 serine protease [Roseivirga pacifica]MCO6372780.1 serine protease [Roseivirga pacifica]MCO6376838.1 serine protease [Roseivirga pacifica]MCO6377883.1 serine protease [Roseivirga pacifica]